MKAIAIDFETANERRDSACAVGLAWIEDGRVARRESWLIRPPALRFSPGNIRVHGILPADVRDQPTCPEVLEPVLPDLTDRIVLAHNAGFDMGVLAASLAAWGRPVPDIACLCTLQVARRVFADPAGCGLGQVASRLGIRFAHHDAGEDAYACGEIALAAMRETGTERPEDLAAVLGLPVTRLAGRPAPGPITARVLARREAWQDPAEAGGLRFSMRGSTGNRYALVLEDEPALYLRCSCLAGRNRMRCRHVEALLDGDVTDLLSDNCGDVERLRQRIEAGGGSVQPLRAARRAPADSARGAAKRWSTG